MSIAKFSVGRRGASGKNASYITREGACDSISFHNLNELQGNNEFENKTNAISYAYAREDIEEKGRTHYRLILSWDRQEDTAQAREQTHQFLRENFRDSRAIVGVHQDTEHTHAHIWIDARQVDERKLHIPTKDFKRIDERWTQQYDRYYKTEYAKEYSAKKEQTRQWKRERAGERKRDGKQQRPADKPARNKDQQSNAFFREKEANGMGVVRGDGKELANSNGNRSSESRHAENESIGNGDKGRSNDESRTGGNQQSFEMRDRRIEETKQRIAGSQRQVRLSEQHVDQSQQQLARTEQAVERAGGKLDNITRQAERTEQTVRELHETAARVVERERGSVERQSDGKAERETGSTQFKVNKNSGEIER